MCLALSSRIMHSGGFKFVPLRTLPCDAGSCLPAAFFAVHPYQVSVFGVPVVFSAGAVGHQAMSLCLRACGINAMLRPGCRVTDDRLLHGAAPTNLNPSL
jgi:hypothetical protein